MSTSERSGASQGDELPIGAADASSDINADELARATSVPDPVEPVHGFLDAIPGDLPEKPDQSDLPVTALAAGATGATGVSGASATSAQFNLAQKPNGKKPVKRPGWGFMMSHPAHWFALGFGSGLPWVMPGTFGTLFGWASFVVCMPHFTDAHWALFISSGFVLGIWACGVTGRNLGVSDHGSIVWDEIVAIWLVLWFVPKTPIDQAMAFLVFRIIDITKPQPIRYFDARWKNGFGVMFDDLLAAFFTLLLFAMYYRVVGLPT